MSEDAKTEPKISEPRISEPRISEPRISITREREELATFRTGLALDRTTLAWIRTTLTMSSFGLGMIGFFRTLRMQHETPENIRMHQGAIHFGVALVLIGVVATVMVTASHYSALRKLRAGEMPVAAKWPLSVSMALLLALLALWGLWVFFFD
jgi:putative membrane protein